MMRNPNLLLAKIRDRTFFLRDLDDGRPFRLITFLLEDESLSTVEPPSYGFPSVDSFLKAGVEWLPMELHWTLAILVSNVARWVWQHQDPQGEGVVSAMERIGDLPIRCPIPFFQDRLWSLVNRIAAADIDEHARIELRADMNDLVFSIFGFLDYELEELESGLHFD
jgi:hypothetical protein